MSENESGGSGFGWFLAGLGVGALVGVLYAPKAGKDTRDDLVAASLDAKDKAAVAGTAGTRQGRRACGPRQAAGQRLRRQG